MEGQNPKSLSIVTEENLKSNYPSEYKAIKQKIRIGKTCWIMAIIFTVYLFIIMFIEPYDSWHTLIAAAVIYITLPIGLVKHIKGAIRMHNLRKRAIAEGKA